MEKAWADVVCRLHLTRECAAQDTWEVDYGHKLSVWQVVDSIPELEDILDTENMGVRVTDNAAHCRRVSHGSNLIQALDKLARLHGANYTLDHMVGMSLDREIGYHNIHKVSAACNSEGAEAGVNVAGLALVKESQGHFCIAGLQHPPGHPRAPLENRFQKTEACLGLVVRILVTLRSVQAVAT